MTLELKDLCENNKYLFRGTCTAHYENQINRTETKNKRKYYGCNGVGDTKHTRGIFNLFTAAIFCNKTRPYEQVPTKLGMVYKESKPLLLAIDHEKYHKIDGGLESADYDGREIIIEGLIDLDDIILVQSEEILRKVSPKYCTQTRKYQEAIKRMIGIN